MNGETFLQASLLALVSDADERTSNPNVLEHVVRVKVCIHASAHGESPQPISVELLITLP